MCQVIYHGFLPRDFFFVFLEKGKSYLDASQEGELSIQQATLLLITSHHLHSCCLIRQYYGLLLVTYS